MKEFEWMFFVNEKTGRLGFLPVGAKAGYKVRTKVIKVIKGTHAHAMAECRRMEKEERYGKCTDPGK